MSDDMISTITEQADRIAKLEAENAWLRSKPLEREAAIRVTSYRNRLARYKRALEVALINAPLSKIADVNAILATAETQEE